MVSFVGAPQQHKGKMTPSDLGSKYASPPLNQVLPYPSMPPAPAALYPATTTYSSPSPYMGYSPNPASYPPPPHVPPPAGRYPPQACFPAAYPPQAYPPAPQPSTYYPTGKLTLPCWLYIRPSNKERKRYSDDSCTCQVLYIY